VTLRGAGALVLALACAPIARAAPIACAADCTVLASEAGYAPALMPIADGDTVTFHSLDTSHPTADSTSPMQRCFILPVGVGTDGTVRFRIVDGAVRATTSPETPSATTKTCTTAIAIGDAGFILPFLCSIHPQMRGALVVQA
jgi:plastocyanin